VKALIYDITTGEILHKIFSASNYIDARQVVPGTWVHYGWVDGPGYKMDVSSPNPANHTIIPDPAYSPESQSVQRKDITEKRKELEEKPLTVTVGGQPYTFDYDQYSREIIPKTVDNWEVITATKVTVGGVEKIAWADAANQVRTFSQSEFIALSLALSAAAAQRSDRLHAYARALIQQLPNVTVADLDESHWPMA